MSAATAYADAFLAYCDQIHAAIDVMPDLTHADHLARLVAWENAMKAWRDQPGWSALDAIPAARDTP